MNTLLLNLKIRLINKDLPLILFVHWFFLCVVVPDRPFFLIFLDICVLGPQATFRAQWLILFATSATSFTDVAIALFPFKPDSIWQVGRQVTQVSFASLCTFLSVFSQ